MHKVRPFFAIMILFYICLFDRYTIGKSIIKRFYDIVRCISPTTTSKICKIQHVYFIIVVAVTACSSIIITLRSMCDKCLVHELCMLNARDQTCLIAIEWDRLGSIAIRCDHLQSAVITCNHLRSLAITCDHFWSLAITCYHLQLLAITCNHLQSLAITSIVLSISSNQDHHTFNHLLPFSLEREVMCISTYLSLFVRAYLDLIPTHLHDYRMQSSEILYSPKVFHFTFFLEDIYNDSCIMKINCITK
jgi:hypothetical protein